MPDRAISLRQRDTIKTNALLCQFSFVGSEQPHTAAKCRFRKVNEYYKSDDSSYHAAGTLENE